MRRTTFSSITEMDRRLVTCIKFAPRGEEPFLIDTKDCPLGLPRFSHWRRDGSCLCPPDVPARRWVRS